MRRSGRHLRDGQRLPRLHSGRREGPVREVPVAPFRISPTTVTNARFAEFVEATGHRTEAERGLVLRLRRFLPEATVEPHPRSPPTPWWREVSGASWRRPEGPGSSVPGPPDHPVVHVSWNDAKAFCAWSGTRLPTRPNGRRAARGGLAQARYPWGDELEAGGAHKMNIWQGEFPSHNTARTAGSAPVEPPSSRTASG